MLDGDAGAYWMPAFAGMTKADQIAPLATKIASSSMRFPLLKIRFRYLPFSRR